ncbi:MAG: hypothetical protein A3J63_01870 [Candidatus Moranbacteria bacterium RIFCSPHIGHO2_02_FULL_40_12b]|nr:MAG: hypothetical protein A3J63_01870 [Candidatus Moranbacteria bacterium RIFCSPHIGHO2_02_FULL_40_12b]OGI23475.1 MAG: hypothetical protein A3E91_01665 [Candidatus Moranbacteria bacterium RIFCSPHIGHO2_12_FULL_40_10]
MKKILLKIKEFWEKYEVKIVLIIGFLLVSAISFEFGTLYGQKWQQKSLIIEKTVQSAILPETAQKPLETQNLASDNESTSPLEASNTEQSKPIDKNCVFAGSKNSNKYHIPTCRWAKQIKPQNLVCFKSAEDAAQKGYQPDKNCVK